MLCVAPDSFCGGTDRFELTVEKGEVKKKSLLQRVKGIKIHI